MTVVDACAGPACPEKPESKNPGGIPNVAAELPLCPLPSRTCTWRKADPWCSCPWVSRPLQWVNTHSRYLQRICTNSRSQHQRWALWPCHAKHWGRPCVQVAPISRNHPCWRTCRFTVVSGEVLGLIGAGPLIFTSSDLKRSLHKLSQQAGVDLSQITATSLSVCPSPSGSLGLRYHVKTRERRGSSFSQLGLEPNHTGLTAQSRFFLEESCSVKRSDTQTFSNFFKRVLKLPKRSSSFSK